jgi:hypothetical protein
MLCMSLAWQFRHWSTGRITALPTLSLMPIQNFSAAFQSILNFGNHSLIMAKDKKKSISQSPNRISGISLIYMGYTSSKRTICISLPSARHCNNVYKDFYCSEISYNINKCCITYNGYYL